MAISPRGKTLAGMVVAVALSAGSCSPTASVGPSQDAAARPTLGATPALPTGAPFTAAAWPETGSACGVVGYRGSLGRVEALDARTVRFTLCAPDGGFLARIAHPSLGIVTAAALERLAAAPEAAAFVSGSGAWRIEARAADNVRLAPASGAKPGPSTALILRWNADAAERTARLVNAEVDGISEPAAGALGDLSTNPDVTLVPRASLSVAYLGFGDGGAFATTAVRRAFAQAIDTSRLLAAFPPGSVAAAHLAPCAAAAGCAGAPFVAYNGPAAVAALDEAAFDRSRSYTLRIPDAAVPGLPDPSAVAAALAVQLAATVGVTVKISPMPAAALHAAIADGTLEDLYLDTVASPVADAAPFYQALYTDRPGSAAARRAASIPDLLAAAVAQTSPAARAKELAAVSDAARASLGLVPLASAGGMTAWRSDVAGVITSPLGADPLGAMIAADRGQVVYVQATAPGGGWCGASGASAEPDAWRLCALVSNGLYGLAPDTGLPVPRLAASCAPSADATVWTCQLRTGLRAGDGSPLGAGDVLATFRAAWDAASPARTAARAAGASATGQTWDGLFGGSLNPQAGD